MSALLHKLLLIRRRCGFIFSGNFVDTFVEWRWQLQRVWHLSTVTHLSAQPLDDGNSGFYAKLSGDV